MRGRLLSAFCALAVLVPAVSAQARLSEEYTYTYDQLWRASVRLIAVDFRFPIGDRDPENGYLLFTYRDAGREYHGSLELVRTVGRNETPQVRVTLQVPSMPTYVERMLLDRLSRKLSDDYGQPPPTRRIEPTPAPVTDEDADESDEDAEDDPTS